jgi:hypothetical protein
MEKGEAAVLAVQFGALAVVVLLLTVAGPGQNVQSTPSFIQVYWGDPSSGAVLTSGQTNVVTQNSSSISALFNLAYSTKVSALSASRLCIDPTTKAGVSNTYTNLQIQFDVSRNAYAVTVSPTGQHGGWQCSYTITLTDSISQTAVWVGTVQIR